MPSSIGRERVISITLSETEWRAFLARHPQPVAWLRDRIRVEVEAAERDPQLGRTGANRTAHPPRDS